MRHLCHLLQLFYLTPRQLYFEINFFVKLEKENNRSVINMRTQYLHDTVYDNTKEVAARMTSATSEGVYIFTATGRKNMQWRPPYNKERGQYRP